MLDPKFIRENIDAVKANCKARNVKADVDRFSSLDEERRQAITKMEELRRRQNETASKMKGKLDQAEREELIANGKELKTRVQESEEHLRQMEAEFDQIVRSIPNMTHPDAPVAATEDGNRELRKWGKPREFDFKPLDHLDLGESLDLVDFEAGAKVVGQKFYYLKNEAALLEQALINYALQMLTKEGFVPIVTPDLARESILEGIGFSPRGEETQIYSVANTDLCLIATAEITLGGMLKDTILDEAQLPLRYVGVSHCFRTEAGAAGRESKGLYRVHQFSKVEMFAFTAPEKSDETHEELLKLEEKLFQGLGIPYRVMEICTGDLGGPAYRKFDLEAWMPGRGENGEYGEVTSTSNCTDYQARRLGIRYRKSGEKRPVHVHMLNGTAIAMSRALIAIFENYQEADGTVTIPEALVPYMGGITKIERK